MDLKKLLIDQEGCLLFKQFLKKEFSEENLEFLIQCQSFRQLNDLKLIRKVAKEMYHRYISLDGPKTININSSVLKKIKENLGNPSAKMFEEAESHIFDMVQNDSFSRFVKSESFRVFLSYKKADNSTIDRKRKTSHLTPDFNQIKSEYRNSPKSILAKKWSNNHFIKIVLPDGTNEFISALQNSTIGYVIRELICKKFQGYFQFKIISILDNKEIHANQKISSLIWVDIRIELIINFSIQFPEGCILEIETDFNKLAFYTIDAILSQFGIAIDDVILTNENGIQINKNFLMKSVSTLNNSLIYVNYLSSLRTYLNPITIKDLDFINEEIKIKCIKFKRTRKSEYKPGNLLIIDIQSKKSKRCKEPNKEDIENVDLNDLSFSDETKTDEFLENMMTAKPSSLNFICSNHSYENISYRGPQPKKNDENLYKARLTIIDDEPLYENVDDIKKRKQIYRKRINSTSSFTKYLLPDNGTNSNHPTSSSNNRIKTLSKFHKVI